MNKECFKWISFQEWEKEAHEKVGHPVSILATAWFPFGRFLQGVEDFLEDKIKYSHSLLGECPSCPSIAAPAQLKFNAVLFDINRSLTTRAVLPAHPTNPYTEQTGVPT